MLALPASASAADWYVATPARGGADGGPCSQAQPCATVQHVLNLPAVADNDVVHIGPGEFPGRAVTSKRVTLQGAGAGTTTGFNPDADTYLNAESTAFTAVELLDGGALRRLRAKGGSAGADSDQPQPAIHLRSGGNDASLAYEVQGVVGIGGAKGTVGRPGLQVSDTGGAKPVAATVGGDSYFQAVTGVMAAVHVSGPDVSAALDGVTIAGAPNGTGAAVLGAAALSVANSSIIDSLGHANGILAISNAELNVTATTVVARTQGISATGYAAGQTTRVTVDGSLVHVAKAAAAGTGSALRLTSAASGRTVSATVRNSTLFASGPNVVAGVHAVASGGSRSEATLVNAVARAIDTDGTPGDADLAADSASGSTASIAATTSSFDDRLEADGGTVTAPDSAGNVAGDPRFTDPSRGNFVPQTGSPLIDRADPAQSPGPLDLAGAPRSLDGNGDCASAPDIGAYEAAAVSGTCAPSIALSNRPVRMTPAGLVRLKASCPAGLPSPCAGTLAMRTLARVRRGRTGPLAVVDLGSAPLNLAPGTSGLVRFTLSPADRALVRRYGRLTIVATAALRDPAGRTGSSQVRFGLVKPPRRLLAIAGLLGMRPDGRVRIKAYCPSWEIEACGGTLRLRTRPRPRQPAVALGALAVTVPAGGVRFVDVRLAVPARARVRAAGRLLSHLLIDSRDRAGNRSTAQRPAILRPVPARTRSR
ncbi:MAG TPA: hypothetical protein VNB64_12630 [Solirubrobacteraceae bacterium]|nr:hypothetical protein [Solirubrobacteraceae bacterium]